MLGPGSVPELTYKDNFIVEDREDHDAGRPTSGKFPAVAAEASVGAAYRITYKNYIRVLVNHSGLRPFCRKAPRRQAGFVFVFSRAYQ